RNGKDTRLSYLLRYLALSSSVGILKLEKGQPARWDKSLDKAIEALKQGQVVGVPGHVPSVLRQLQEQYDGNLPVVPVFLTGGGPADEVPRKNPLKGRLVRIVFGDPMPLRTSVERIQAATDELGTEKKMGMSFGDIDLDAPGP